MPNSIDNRSPGQWIIVTNQPLRQRQPAITFGVRIRQIKLPCCISDNGNRTRLDFFALRLNIATMQDVNGAGISFCASGSDKVAAAMVDGAAVNHLLGWQIRQV